MAYLLGTDEAGYGPNLGPLMVSATLWRSPDGIDPASLYEQLEGAVTRTPRAAPTAVPIADSKSLYQPGKGLRTLERGLWPCLCLLGLRPTTWRGLWAALAPGWDAEQADAPWYAEYDRALDVAAETIESSAATLAAGLASAGIELLGMRSRAVFPEAFNRRVDACGSKGEALSQITLELAAELMEPLAVGPIRCLCDKHGGRNQYQRLLADRFPDALIEIYAEGAQASIYRFGPSERRVEFTFQVKGERFLPVALASMCSKYLRELAMEAWNDYWCRRVPGLAPTAGYPQDARRFMRDIADAQAALGIADERIWRKR